MNTLQHLVCTFACTAAPALALTQLGDPEQITSTDRVLLVADFDQDGTPDIIASSDRGWEVSVYSRNNSGDYADSRRLTADGRNLTSLSLGDADGDGQLDVFAIDRESEEILVYPNSGSGLLGSPTVLSAAQSAGLNLVVADMDGDGDVDIVVGGFAANTAFQTTAGVALLDNLGGFAFSAPTPLVPSSILVFELVGLDVDDDGDMDLLGSIQQGTSRAELFRNDPGTQLTQISIAPTSTGQSSPQAADLDGDGVKDIAVIGAGSVGTNVVMARGLGGGSFAAPVQITALPQISVLLTPDADGDGDADLLAVNLNSPFVFDRSLLHLIENAGNGTFAIPQSFEVDRVAAETARRGVNDLDADGAQDILFMVERFDGASIGQIKMRGPAGPFGVESIRYAGNLIPRVRSLAAADLDGDGTDVIVGASNGGLSPRSLRRKQPPILDGAPSYSVADLTGVSWIAFEDLDGDSQPETLAVADPEATLYYIDGLGNAPAVELALSSIPDAEPSLQDYDGDGDLDVLWMRSSGNNMDVIENLGSGSWGAPGTLFDAPSFIFLTSVRTGDLNNDGLQDVACAFTPGFFTLPTTGIALRQPDGTLSDVVELDLSNLDATGVTGIVVDDVNGDGDSDLLMSVRSGLIGLSTNLGGGNFAQVVLVAQTSESILGMEGVDLDHAPGLELVTLEAGLGVRAYARSIGTMNWQMVDEVLVSGLDKISLADLGGDNDLDLLLSSSETGNAYIVDNELRGEVGSIYCGPAVQNSTGQTGKLVAVGSNIASANALELRASDLPIQSFGFFLASRAQDDVFPVTGSIGRLCLGGSIGRYVGPGQIQQSDLNGRFSLALDLTQIPQPNGPEAAMAGDVWNFQAWHRDLFLFNVTSNFTEAVSVTLQ